MKKLLTAILFIADYVLTILTTMYLWNGIISGIFSIKQLGIAETIALSFFAFYIRYKPTESKEVENYNELILKDCITTLIMLLMGMTIIKFVI